MNQPSHLAAVADSSAEGDAIQGRLSELSHAEFEQRLSAAFDVQGYEVSRDSGPDCVELQLKRDDRVWFVRCALWRIPVIDVVEVRELLAAVDEEGVAGGLMVCAGSFTDAARDAARGTRVRLINGAGLSGMMLGEADGTNADACPRCGSTLVERATEQRRFRGCETFPSCFYTARA